MPAKAFKLTEMRQHAADIFGAGLRAVDPVRAVKRSCNFDGRTLTIQGQAYDLRRFRRIYVIGAGKAAAAMASALEDILNGRISQGIITVKYHHGLPLKHIAVTEAGHPLPDENGLKGAEAIRKLAESAAGTDIVICLLSGGASALLPSPAQGLTLEDKKAAIDALLSCGADIGEINTIRKHISGLKGGRLARACFPATLATLVLSDVVGDALDIIASGPTTPDPSTYQDCLDIVRRYGLKSRLPESILNRLQKGRDGRIAETPKPEDTELTGVQNSIIGNNFQALDAAGRHAAALGYHPLILSSMIEGETRDAAFFHAAVIREIAKTRHPVAPPACILSGGETTVTISGNGLGGRNQEFVLASAIHLDGLENMVLLSAGTDGTDGPTDAAGAVMDASTLERSRDLELNPQEYLDRNDSYNFFKRLGDLFITGPTRTNVMDLRIALVGGK